jgi:uncharacterized protein (TIGR03382 family)
VVTARGTAGGPALAALAAVLVLGPAAAGATTRPVVGGTPSAAGADPAVAALVVGGRASCTAALVAPRVLLTAAHCAAPLLERGAPGTASAFFGNVLAEGGAGVAIAGGLLHPDWDWLRRRRDVALLLLAAPAPATPLPLRRAALDGDFVGARTRHVGFGFSAPAAADGGVKRETTSRVVALDDETFVNGASPGQTCTGDSGGPVFADEGGREELVGVVSRGDIACAERGVNVRVDRVVDTFIDPYVAAVAAGEWPTDRAPSLQARASPSEAPGPDRGGHEGCAASGRCPPGPISWAVALVWLGQARRRR